ncbi:MAG: hypothetical protein HFI74_12665 [Lachnospiraceae bacterium]|nr:hypothetical protein [Lachnospiraceae bacterium]
MITIWILERLLLCSFEIYMLYDLGKKYSGCENDKTYKAAVCLIMRHSRYSYQQLSGFQNKPGLCSIDLFLFSILNFKGTVLKRGSVAVVYYIRDHRIAKQLSRMPSATQRIPALHHNS